MVNYMDLNNLIITKIEDMSLYKKQCLNCGWKNPLDVIAHYCPKCGNDLKFMTLTEISDLSEDNECVSSID